MHMAHVINGTALAQQIVLRLKEKLHQQHQGRPPGLATILVGDDKASAIYVSNKRKRAEEIGIKSFHFQLAADSSQAEVVALIQSLNSNDDVDAILVQLPLPRHLAERDVIDMIDPEKDADGIHPLNLGYLMRGDPRVLPCTPHGIMYLIKSVDFPIAGKHAVIVGRSNIVGKPMAHLLLQDDATVTICHSRTADLPAITKQADILVAAVGRPEIYYERACETWRHGGGRGHQSR